MGIDLLDKRGRRAVRTAPKGDNPYIYLLTRIYRFLARRTGSRFNKTILKRLCQSRVTRRPISLSKVAVNSKKDRKVVVVADVLDDIRLKTFPKVEVCALRFSEGARNRIEGAGGRCLTFDQLATESPTGANVILLRGKKNREAVKHFGAPGTPGSHAKPYTTSKTAENARGRRASRQWKVKAFKHS